MNPNADNQPLREKIQRRELTPAEQAELRAWLAAHPEAAADWETEKNLSRLFARLPDAPVSSNFTARVMQAVEREARAESRNKFSRPWWWRVLLPRAAVATLLVGFGIFSWDRYQAGQRTKFARELTTTVADVKSLPSAEALEDFDAILRLPPSGQAAVDEELFSLLAALQ